MALSGAYALSAADRESLVLHGGDDEWVTDMLKFSRACKHTPSLSALGPRSHHTRSTHK